MTEPLKTTDLKKAAKADGRGIVVFSPLEGGILAGRYADGVPQGSRYAGGLNEWQLDKVKRTVKLSEIAGKRGQTLAQMSLSWVMKDDDITGVIIGASSVGQLKDNLGAVSSAPFTDEELFAIDRIALGNI